jgi:hypothetical protein
MRRFNAAVFVIALFICRATAPIGATSRAGEASAPQLSSTDRAAVDQLIPWLLEQDRQLRGIAFSEVILDTTGKRVFAVIAGTKSIGGLLIKSQRPALKR